MLIAMVLVMAFVTLTPDSGSSDARGQSGATSNHERPKCVPKPFQDCGR